MKFCIKRPSRIYAVVYQPSSSRMVRKQLVFASSKRGAKREFRKQTTEYKKILHIY